MIKRVILILCFLVLCFAQIVSAQTESMNPPQIAEDIRQSLFDAQVALMSADTVNAQAALDEAQQLYQQNLSVVVVEVAPEIDERLLAGFASAISTLENADVAALAALRSQIWTSLLQASNEIVVDAIAAGDGETAALWLPLRDFRVSTRFSRPGTDATLAVNALLQGTMSAQDVLNAVDADLLDTYQAQLTRSLADADEAHQNNFHMRRAEEAGLAAGYFEILAEAYGTQRGEAALSQARTYFSALVDAAVANDAEAFVAARAVIDTSLAGFRAAPLSDAELARRAGQLMRFIALVPVEYARGVRNGVITNDIEVQEAITFYEGALAAFIDIQDTLNGFNADTTAQIATLLTVVQTQISETADPAALQATIDELNGLLTATIPADWLTNSTGSDIDVIMSALTQVDAAAAAGEYALAESARLEAYALLELGLEQRLRGFAPDLAVRIESLFWQGTQEQPGLSVLLANEASIIEVRAALAQLEAAFGEAQLLLGASSSAPAAVATNAAIIVFREGLEAVLILASLLASLRTAEEARFRRPLLVGAGLAFVASGLTWVAANGLLNVLLPFGERLEAVVSLIAIAVLLLITNWFFHKVYWTGWMANFHAQKRRLVGGFVTIALSQTIGLVLLGFTSIYREGFETVLFLQSLVLEAGIPVVLQGVALGLLGTAVVGMITFALQVRLPYKKMLVVTGVMIGVVLLTMVGNTVHVMQAVGWLPITPVQNIFIPYWMGQWFGLFATWETIILQVAAAGFVIGSYFLAEHQSKQGRQRVSAVREAKA